VVVSSATAQLDGSVSDDDSALAGAHVRVVPEPETLYKRPRARSARADQTGHFSLTGLAPGTYRVLEKYGASRGDGALRSEPQIVTLSERDHKTLQLTLAKSQAE
jgi:Carboxypeptidase regulatory-like domain